ncbi:MAG: serine protease Do, partial [Bradyrhizobium sp.]
MTGSDKLPPRKSFASRRITLLGSVAVLGSAIIFSGPLGYGRFTESAFAATPATQTQQGPNGFADLVAKVKPAVISVRVQLDESADASNMLSRNGEDP